MGLPKGFKKTWKSGGRKPKDDNQKRRARILMLTDEEKAKGVIACSAGNHAQGVALAAAKNGIRSIICLPDGAPISKVEATKSHGAEVCLVKGVYDDAYAEALRQRDEYGYTFIHPFDDEDVIAG